MFSANRQELDYLQEAAAGYRIKGPARLTPFAVIAGSFIPLVGWQISLAWLMSVVIAFSLIGPWLGRRAWPNDEQRLIWTTAYLALVSIIIGAIAVAAAIVGGLWGWIAGEFVLFCATSLVTASALRSAVAFYAAMAPLVLYLFVLALVSFAFGAHSIGPYILMVGTMVLALHTCKTAGVNRRLAISINVALASAEDSRTAAEASTAAKSAFVAMVSHELRTPISGILAGAADLQANAPDVASRNNAALVLQSARMMRTLLNDLLDLSKIEAGRMDVEIITFDLRLAILETVRFWRPELRRKRLWLRLKGCRQLPQWVSGDPTRLRQILNNLISNSVKFTDTGGLVFRMQVRDEGNDPRYSIDVEDTGPGMDEAQVGKLFTAFEQLGASTARAHGGTGLGLHISRELARLMDGDLTVSSAPKLGSTFRVDLPLRAADTPAEEVPAEVDGCHGLHLLIVDDHRFNREAFSLMLVPVAEHVVCAEDGAQALAALAIEPFDLVLMDIHMPGMSGLEATRQLRASHGPNRWTPVIALTGSVSERDVDQCLAVGMDGFVTKPVEVAELIAAIQQALSRTVEIVPGLESLSA